VNAYSVEHVRRGLQCFVIALVATALLAFAPSPAAATKIERVVTPRGIEVWVVRDATVPLIALDFGFRGGAAQDPEGKSGTANLMVGLLDEGAGPVDSKAFHERLERKAIELNISAGRDTIRGTVRTLKENQDEAFELLRLALNEPRFEAPDVERIRSQVISQLQRASTSPNDIASRTWWGTAFPNHPYGRAVNGTLESVARITADDMRTYVRNVFARDNLKIAIVGDIDVETVGRLIDHTFGSLPAKAELAPVPAATIQGLGQQPLIDLNVPQTVVMFGGPGVARNDPDFMAAYVMMHVFGGGSFTSRLYREVREKRGLAYGVSDNLIWQYYGAVHLGATATRNDATKDTIDVIKEQLKLMAANGPTQEELDKAKTYLKGAFALGFDTSTKIASQLVAQQLDNLSIDYIDRRSALIDAVTIEDTKRMARRLLEPGLLAVVVGRPQGVTAK
jgi:zinc protease